MNTCRSHPIHQWELDIRNKANGTAHQVGKLLSRTAHMNSNIDGLAYNRHVHVPTGFCKLNHVICLKPLHIFMSK